MTTDDLTPPHWGADAHPHRDAALARALPSAVGVTVGRVVELGWGDHDGERVFRAVVAFDNGPPDLPFSVVWDRTPIALTLASGAQAGAAGDRSGAAPAGGLPGVEEIAEALAIELSHRTYRRSCGGMGTHVALTAQQHWTHLPAHDKAAWRLETRQIALRLSAAGTGDAGRDEERYRHVKCGTIYKVLGHGSMQSALDDRFDDKAVTIYESENGQTWARLTAEFMDGRFEPLNNKARAVQEQWRATFDPDPATPPEAPARSTAADGLRDRRLSAAWARLRLTNAARDVLAERRRQVEIEGWGPEHDDAHRCGELAAAAASYAVGGGLFRVTHLQVPAQVWPYRWLFKPQGTRRNLVKAGALILAEIERLDRCTPRQEPTP